MTSAVIKPSFSLGDDAAEQFFESRDGAYVTTTQPIATESSSGTHNIEQFEVEESTGTRSFVSKAYSYADVTRYSSLFTVTDRDVLGRIARACLPYRGLLEPPLQPIPTTAPNGHAAPDESESNGGADSEDAVEATAAAVPASVEYEAPFNPEPDFYGPLWIPVTLIMCLAMGSNVYAFVRSVVARQDIYHDARLSALDFTNLVTAASCVWGFLVAASAAVVFGKQYVEDTGKGSVSNVVFVYGYSMAPLVPAVALSSVLGQSASWLLILVGTGLSLLTVLTNLWPKRDVIPAAVQEMLPMYVAGEPGDEDGVTYGANENVSRTQRTPVWWLRFGVACAHVLAGLLLKLRFF